MKQQTDSMCLKRRRSLAYRRRTNHFLFVQLAFALVWLALFVGAVQAQKAQESPKTQAKDATAKAPSLAESKAEFVRLTTEYKQSLDQLADLYRTEAKNANERATTLAGLFQRGLVAGRDVTAARDDAATADAKVVELEQRKTAADTEVADFLVESEAIESAPASRAPMPDRGRISVGATFLRYSGFGSWSLSEAWKIENFYLQRFGKRLPISTYGQSRLHDAWGWDHRNAMDIGLHPNSVEGQALMAYLRQNGIPFGAFTVAIPGVATGPHIHVGLPSHHIQPK